MSEPKTHVMKLNCALRYLETKRTAGMHPPQLVCLEPIWGYTEEEANPCFFEKSDRSFVIPVDGRTASAIEKLFEGHALDAVVTIEFMPRRRSP